MFSRIPNLQVYEFFSQFFSYFLLKQGSRIDIKNVSITIYFHFAAHLKENKKCFAKKIVDSEFVKTCHEQVTNLSKKVPKTIMSTHYPISTTYRIVIWQSENTF